MIELDRVGVTYADAVRPAIHDVSLEIAEGELCLVAGPTGSGKSTLLRTINGLVPHFTGGTLAGRVVVGGRDTGTHTPRELADLVGFVGQDPVHGFVTDVVEEELAYAMEQLAVPPAAMRTRVEETLDLLGIADLRGRPLRDLSGGQQQRVAIGSVLAAGPRILVLDEPTSALDPTAAEEVLAAILRLVHDLGVTVVLAEHRLERAIQYADRLISAGLRRRGPLRRARRTHDRCGHRPARRRARPAGRLDAAPALGAGRAPPRRVAEPLAPAPTRLHPRGPRHRSLSPPTLRCATGRSPPCAMRTSS